MRVMLRGRGFFAYGSQENLFKGGRKLWSGKTERRGAGKVLFSRIFQFRVPDNNTCKLWENLKIKLFDLYLNCDQGKRVAGSNLFNI